jgi:putative tryptophan/tyrosine transport system substrate-binding protein
MAAHGPRTTGVPVIGVLNTVSASDWKRPMRGFHRGLGEMGFVEGRNVAIEYRWAEGRLDQMPALAADLVGRKVAVVLANAIPAARVVMAATKTIPIVFTTTTDPVAVGLVANLNRPDGNVTGVTGLLSELVPKGLQLLRQVIPAATRFAALVNQGNPVTMQYATESGQTAARRLGLEILVLKASNENEIEAAFADAVEQRADALFCADQYFESRRDQMAALGLRHALR